MARHAVAATAARHGAGGAAERRWRPVPRLSRRRASAWTARSPSGWTATPALAVEDWLRDGLAAGRARATRPAGSTALGAHRADMVLTDAATGTPAALASTGEQKALLVGVVLGHAALIAEARGFAPLLLLDEPAVHLDPDAARGAVRGAGCDCRRRR